MQNLFVAVTQGTNIKPHEDPIPISIKKDPFTRKLRVGKPTDMALEHTLRLFLSTPWRFWIIWMSERSPLASATCVSCRLTMRDI
jgi:hypothetical protein